MLNMDMPHSLPAWGRDPVQRVVYQATRENVVHTMVDGRFLYRNGSFLTLDPVRTLADAERHCAAVLTRGNIPPVSLFFC